MSDSPQPTGETEAVTVEMPVPDSAFPPPPPVRPIPAPQLDDDQDERQPWPATQLRTRLGAITRVGPKRNPGLAAKAVEDLLDDALWTIGYWTRRFEAEQDANRRLRAVQRRQFTANRALQERIRQIEGQGQQRTPVGAIAAVAGGQSQGERIIADAKAHAARIVADAEDERARRLALAQLESPHVGEPRPEPTNRLADDLLAVARWLPKAITAAETRVEALRSEVPAAEQLVLDLREERDSLAGVLPIAGAVLTGEVRDVNEVGAGERAEVEDAQVAS